MSLAACGQRRWTQDGLGVGRRIGFRLGSGLLGKVGASSRVVHYAYESPHNAKSTGISMSVCMCLCVAHICVCV